MEVGYRRWRSGATVICLNRTSLFILFSESDGVQLNEFIGATHFTASVLKTFIASFCSDQKDVLICILKLIMTPTDVEF